MESIFFLIIQTITSVAVGLTLLASLILIIGACGNVKSKCPYVLAAIFQFFGGKLFFYWSLSIQKQSYFELINYFHLDSLTIVKTVHY